MTGVTGESFLKVEDLARKLSVSERTIYDLVARGKLASVKVGRSRRFDPADVAEFLENNRTGARR